MTSQVLNPTRLVAARLHGAAFALRQERTQLNHAGRAASRSQPPALLSVAARREGSDQPDQDPEDHRYFKQRGKRRAEQDQRKPTRDVAADVRAAPPASGRRSPIGVDGHRRAPYSSTRVP